jgi:hypothetical protein
MSGPRMLASVLAFSAMIYLHDLSWMTSQMLGVCLVALATVICLVGCRLGGQRQATWSWRLSILAMASVVAWEFWKFFRAAAPLSWNVRDPRTLLEGMPSVVFWPATFAVLVLFALVTLSYAWLNMPAPRWRFLLVLALYGYLGARTILVVARPRIDVLAIEEGACAALLKGKNPYSSEYPSPYADMSGYPARYVRDGKLAFYCYPPLTVITMLPGHLLGDVRWSMLAAILTSAAFMVAAGRRLGLPAGHPVELASIAFLLHPSGFFILQQGWVEPLFVLMATGTAWAALAGWSRAQCFALLCAATIKQTGFLCVPALARVGQMRLGSFLIGAALPILLLALFFVWGPAGVWGGCIDYLAQLSPRFDCFSVPALAWLRARLQLPTALGFIAAGLAALVALGQKRLLLSQAALGNAGIYLAFFLFGKAAHVNYYWGAASFLPLAFIAAAGETKSASTSANRNDLS